MVAIVYGSTTGNTEDAANKIHQYLGSDKTALFDVKDAGLAALEYFDKLIFALPTWDYGEVQADWQDVWDEIDTTDFSNKTVAFVGMGDQFAYAEWFQDAMGMLHEKVAAKGAKVVGHWPVTGYEFDASKALTENKETFAGLALDEDCQPELTEQRVKEWCEQIKPAFFG